MITGGSGVGKSNIILDFFKNLNIDKYSTKLVNFSAQTTADSFVNIFFDKDKFVKVGKDTIGAPP